MPQAPTDAGPGAQPTEYILDDDECPLSILMHHPPSQGPFLFLSFFWFYFDFAHLGASFKVDERRVLPPLRLAFSVFLFLDLPSSFIDEFLLVMLIQGRFKRPGLCSFF